MKYEVCSESKEQRKIGNAKARNLRSKKESKTKAQDYTTRECESASTKTKKKVRSALPQGKWE